MGIGQIENLKSEALQLFSDQKFEELNTCLRKMVELNDPWGMHYLAGNYFYGHGVQIDQYKANELYLRAANLDFADSQMVVGNNLCGGIGVEKNFPEGMTWLNKAAEKNNGYANFLLAIAYLDGSDIPKDTKLGLEYLEKAAELGDARAMTRLAGYKFSGLEIEKNIPEAIELFESAAESAARRNKAREDRAIELAEQSKARQAAEEEKQRKAAEKLARDEEERLRVVAVKEAARLAKQQDLERRLAENKEKEAAKQAAAEVAALLAKQQELDRQNQKQTQAAALLDDLSKAPDAPKAEVPEPVVVAKEPEDPEELEELEAEGPVLQIVKGAVHVPVSIPAMDASVDAKTELPPAYDMSELMPAPAVLTIEAAPQSEVQVESGKELIDRILTGAEPAPDEQEPVPQSARSENRFQKIINTNRDLAKENQTLKARVEKLLDEVHGYQVEGELVGSILDTQERSKRQAPPQNAAERYLKPKPFSVVDEAKKEMLKYLSTREDEIDHTHKSVLFLKYMQDPFYMNVFVQNNQVSEWWPVIDSIYNSIGLSAPDWSKSKVEAYQSKAQPQPQPIRARTATLGAPVASSEQPMDRIAQHLGNMGI